jgi:2-(1,2-epoxy-1,2-dihydrophenyl)acetyl-CoA isomerase
MTMKYLSTPGLEVRHDAGILRVEIRNPQRRNALDDVGVKGFIDLVELAQNDEDVRAVLISGSGGDFCSGFDLVARNSDDGARPRVGSIVRRLPTQTHRLVPMLLALPVPVVAAVHGFAVGLGLQLVLASDFAVVSSTAKLWEPFAVRGMTPDGGASWLLPRLVGPVRARELLLLGRRLNGAEAEEWGLVHSAVPDDEVDAAAEELATSLASGPTVALGLSKTLINAGQEQSLTAHLSDEAFAMEMSSRSPDFREGLSAFKEKRSPRFSGR